MAGDVFEIDIGAAAVKVDGPFHIGAVDGAGAVRVELEVAADFVEADVFEAAAVQVDIAGERGDVEAAARITGLDAGAFRDGDIEIGAEALQPPADRRALA